MIKAVIIEDEFNARMLLKEHLKRMAIQIDIIGEAENVENGIEMLKNTSPDLVFLDIQLENKSGFDILEKIAATGSISFKVIFITAYDKYAVQAIKYSAFDYLLKPIVHEELVKALNKFIDQKTNEQLSPLQYKLLIENIHKKNNSSKKIIINSQEKIRVCEISDIVRCESKSNYTQIYLKDNRNILSTKSLKEYQELLKDEPFFRIHNSHLININKIDSYNKSEEVILMTDGTVIPVSRGKKEELLELLSQL